MPNAPAQANTYTRYALRTATTERQSAKCEFDSIFPDPACRNIAINLFCVDEMCD